MNYARRLCIETAVVFCVSTIFPVVAAFVKDREAWPKWWGVVDVLVSVILVGMAALVMAAAKGRESEDTRLTAYRAYRVLTHGILAGLVAFFLLDDFVVWSNCLSGFVWRTWLLLYVLPAWIGVSGFHRPCACTRPTAN